MTTASVPTTASTTATAAPAAALKKDKAKVLGEHFDDARIRTFLHVNAYSGLSRDYCALERAYRSMIPENFATFVRFFAEEGRDLNAVNGDGETLLQVIRQHRHGDEYSQPLIDAGAR